MATAPFVPRVLDLAAALRRKSAFLLGPRLTGKSSLIRRTLRDAKVFNLLDNDVFLRLSRRPARLREELSDERVVVIDEVQKLPALLDEVQLLIEERGLRFLLTGSSARKLRRRGVNLLGGRATTLRLHPFVSAELKDLDLTRALRFGLLPPVYLSDRPEAELSDYAGTYLREEIVEEGLARNVPAFSRFLEVAALCNGKQINFENIANDAQVARSTAQQYFEILKDTLLAYELPSWRKSVKRKPIHVHKFFFFDAGVAHHLRGGSQFGDRSQEFRDAFEALLFHELRAYADYRLGGAGDSLHYWRSTSGFEVDFILGDSIAIEAKASHDVPLRELAGLRAIGEERKLKRLICVSRDPVRRVVGDIEILPWREFLSRLWADELR